MKHWIDLGFEWNKDEYLKVIDDAIALKNAPADERGRVLKNKNIYLMFFNQSVRTRSSFAAGIHNLGGNCISLDPFTEIYRPAMPGKETPYSTERVSDVARVLSSYGDAIGIRIYGEPAGWKYGDANDLLHEFAKWSSSPVINLECDKFHPCQALADMIIIKERLGDFKKKKIVVSWAYSGSWHKPVAVPQSTALAAGKVGMDVTLAYPEGFELAPESQRGFGIL